MIRLFIAAGAVVLFLLITLIVLVRRRRAKTAKLHNHSRQYHASQAQVVEQAPASTPEPISIPEPEPVIESAPAIAELADSFEEIPESAAVSAVVETPANNPPSALTPPSVDAYAHLPQDSQLRRHYQNHLMTMLLATKPSRPTEMNLKRHFDALVAAEFAECLQDPAAIARLEARYDQHRKYLCEHTPSLKAVLEPLAAPVLEAVIETVVEPELAITAAIIEAVVEPIVKPTVVDAIAKFKLPEDATLRRHTLTHLRSQVEANLPPRPTDSTLLRHYHALFNAELDKLLG